MSATTEKLNKIKTLLGIETKLEKVKLENGTEIEATKFAEGESVFILTEDERVPLPVGSYELEDNRTLNVETEGVILSIVEAKLDEHEEVEEEEVKEEETEEKVEAEYVTKEELGKEINKLKEELAEMLADLMNEKKEMSEENEELKEEKAELKEQLSAPATEAIKHAPISETSVPQVEVPSNASIQDRIMANISNITKK